MKTRPYENAIKKAALGVALVALGCLVYAAMTGMLTGAMSLIALVSAVLLAGVIGVSWDQIEVGADGVSVQDESE
jgi:hypothetical protein